MKTLVFSFLKNKKTRKGVLVALLVAVLIAIGAILLTTAAPLAGLGMAVKAMTSYVTDLFDPSMTEEEMRATMDADKVYTAIQRGYHLTEDDEVGMRIRDEDFQYLIQRVYDYNHAGEQQREITVWGRKTTTVETETTIPVEGTVDDDDPEKVGPGYDENGEPKPATQTGTAGTTTEEVEEDVPIVVTVDNSMYEGLYDYDYRLLYYYCVLAAIDRKTSDRELFSVTPRDKDQKPITTWESREKEDSERYYINREDIDRVFAYTAVNYDYYFDVLRDENEEYGFDQCRELPHTEIRESDGTSETVYYIPASYLRSGKGAWCSVENVKSSDGTLLTGTRCVFDFEAMKASMKALCADFDWEKESNVWDSVPGGKSLYYRFEEMGAAGQVLKEVTDLQIVIRSEWGELTGYSFGSNGYYSTIGEAAVAWAIAVSCHDCLHGGNAAAAKQYTQDTSLRMTTGADCSSLVYRAYSAVGLIWPGAYIGNTKNFYDYFSNNKACVIAEHATGPVDESKLMPGDVIMMPAPGSKEMVSTNNHIILYAGNGMIVHASSVYKHVHVETLAGYYESSLRYRSWYSVYRPYIGLNTSVTYVTKTSGSGIDGETMFEIAKSATEKELIDCALWFAVNDAKTSDILPSVTAAQMLVESGWFGTVRDRSNDENGNYYPSIAQSCTNYFGMKASLSDCTWSGSTWDQVTKKRCLTWEQEPDGTIRWEYYDFRVYGCIEESVTDHAAYLRGAMAGSSYRYPEVTKLKDYKALIQHIKDGGYATDNNYVTTLCNAVRRYNLDRYDSNYRSISVPVPKVLTSYVSSSSAAGIMAGESTISWDKSWPMADLVTTSPPPVKMYVPGNANGYVVFLNAGHGGNGKSLGSSTPNDPVGSGHNQYGNGQGYNENSGYTGGTTYVSGGTTVPESRWTYEMSLLIKDRLLAKGYSVVLARSSDDASGTYPENAARSVYANNTADIHVAIHFDSQDQRPYWYRPSAEERNQSNYSKVAAPSAELGEAIAKELAQSLGFSGNEDIGGFLTGYAWSTIPIVYIETMGRNKIPQYLNRNEEIADAYVKGIETYFAKHTSPGRFASKIREAAAKNSTSQTKGTDE